MSNHVKKLIEVKKIRLDGLVKSQHIKRDYADRLLKEYAQFVCRYFGC